jgi:hypothetical protein
VQQFLGVSRIAARDLRTPRKAGFGTKDIRADNESDPSSCASEAAVVETKL